MKSLFHPLTLNGLHISRLRHRSLRRIILYYRTFGHLGREQFTYRSIEKRAVQQRGITTSSLSYVEGPKEPPLITVTIPEHFYSVVSQHGDRPAAIFRPPTSGKSPDALSGTVTLTYEALDIQSDILAHSLTSLGVKKGDRVAISLGNVAEHVVATYAIFKLGAILVPLNPTFNEKQLVTALSHLRVSVLIIGAVTDLAYKPCRGRSNHALLEALVPDLAKSGGRIESPSVPTLRSVVVVDNTLSHPRAAFPPLQDLRALTPFSSLLPSAAHFSKPSRASLPRPGPVIPDSPLSPGETINVQFTSGTTSTPKAAMLSHTNILNNGRLIADRMGLVPGDRIACPPPLFHCFGCVLGLQATATTGAAILFPSPAFDPAAALLAAAEHGATGLHGVPTMFAAELELLHSSEFVSKLREAAAAAATLRKSRTAADKEVLFANLRKGIAAGSSVPEPLMRQLNARLGLQDLVICYGMTETSPVSCMTSPADSPAKRARSVGRVMPHTRVKVVDRNDSTRVLPRGECGELAVSGYLLMKRYFDDQARTDEVLIKEQGTGEGEEEGEGEMWMLTGDEARIDEEGFVEITGRIKDLIIRGGENIHPLEIEVEIMRHELVREASVVGVPDEKYGEVVAAFVAVHGDVRTDGAEPVYGSGEVVEGSKEKALSTDEVKDWVRKHLSGHLVPKYVFWIDEFPKTASGKIQKFKLRELAKHLIHTAS